MTMNASRSNGTNTQASRTPIPTLRNICIWVSETLFPIARPSLSKCWGFRRSSSPGSIESASWGQNEKFPLGNPCEAPLRPPPGIPPPKPIHYVSKCFWIQSLELKSSVSRRIKGRHVSWACIAETLAIEEMILLTVKTSSTARSTTHLCSKHLH